MDAMPFSLPKWIGVSSGLFLFLPLLISSPPAQEITARWDREQGVLEWRYEGRPLLIYVFSTNQFKPYVREFYTLAGDNVLRDAPADHLHHHGLMYAITVNGVNFWEEHERPGIQRPIQFLEMKSGRNQSGLPEAGFTQLIHWMPSREGEGGALLLEKRTLTLTVSGNELALHWRADFEAGPGPEKVQLHGTAYHGLGLRLPAEWDQAARHGNSENSPYSENQNWDVTAGRWAAVWHRMDSREITVALFSEPSNQGESRFFSMLNPFAYLSATQALEQAPLEFQRGEKFRLEHLFLVYSPGADAEALEKRYQRWIAGE
jgi:hypothetical protein